MSDRDAQNAMAVVVARMVHPSSERAALHCIKTNSATLVLLRLDTGKRLKLDKFYRLSDVLVREHDLGDFVDLIEFGWHLIPITNEWITQKKDPQFSVVEFHFYDVVRPVDTIQIDRTFIEGLSGEYEGRPKRVLAMSFGPALADTFKREDKL